MLPLVCVSHLSPATYWILESLSLRYGSVRLSKSYQACPYSSTSALLSWSGTLCPRDLLHPLSGWYDFVDELRLIRAHTGATLY